MLRRALAVSALAAASCGHAGGRQPAADAPLPQVAPGQLRPARDFAAIHDMTQRSKALFLEASRVLMHPRCVNCHPSGGSPLQGEDSHVHDPPVVRGEDDRGVVGMRCSTCHQDHNLELAFVPGAPDWHLAKRSMAWQGKSARAVCEQLKDPERNGGRTLEQVVDHSAHDPLVAWGWHPGASRAPAPGTQAAFAALVRAWVETGAACPPEGARP